jgi:hypothetical protein
MEREAGLSMKIKRFHFLLAVLAVCVLAFPFRATLRRPVVAVIQRARGQKTVQERVQQYGSAVHARLAPAFARVRVAYPPARVTLVGLKAERRMEVWVAGQDGPWAHVRDYRICGLSGVLGPKLERGDQQVPEGLYRVESLNPNSLYHLALRVNYPSAQDRDWGRQNGRSALGSDIMIHGSNCSVGCLAMGDEAAEDLFVLAAETGIDHVSIILAPVDFRTRELPAKMPPLPSWSGDLYQMIRKGLAELQGSPSPSAAGNNTP